MALIRCPECGNSISDRAEKCPHCGLPASYFSSLSKNTPHMKEAGLDYKNLQNVLISFERDHAQLFSAEHYISHRDAQRLRDTYGKYNESLTNKLIFQYVCNNAAAIRVDIDLLRRFLRQMQSLDGDITAHNTTYPKLHRRRLLQSVMTGSRYMPFLALTLRYLLVSWNLWGLERS